MSQELKQRVNGSSEKSEVEFASKNSNLLEISPDFAIKVLFKHDPKKKATDLESEANLKILLSFLKINGFEVNVRPDTNTNYMILFITITETSFNKLVTVSNQIDSLFNVKENATSDEKISLAERLRLIYLKLTLPKSKGGCEIEVGKNNVVSILPVKHILNLEKETSSNWKNMGKIFRNDVRLKNVRFLKENLGTKYAIYYRFVQAYVSSVGCISLIGILAWYFFGNYSLIYAAANLVVGLTCYSCIYATEKKTERDWNLENIDKTQTVFLEDSELIPTWKTLIRQTAYIPITLLSATGLFSVQFLCFLLEIFITEIYQGPLQSILALIPTILVCVLVPVGTMIYGIISKQYLKFEKNPTKEDENKSLLIKMFVFNCLASYSPLLITAFIYLPVGYMLNPYLQTIQALVSRATSVHSYIPKISTLESHYQVNNLRMSSQIFYFMVINQVIGTFVEFVVPIVLSKVLNISKIASILGTPASAKTVDFKNVDDPEEHDFLEIVRADFLKPEISIDDDYRQHVLQYGFLMLFGPVWCSGALSCFVFGLVQQEGDYIKFIKLSKPAVGARSSSSQPWVSFMRYLLIIGSFVSIAITLMYNNNADDVNEISCYVNQTCVENTWYTIIFGSVASGILMQILVHSVETIVDKVYDDKENADFQNEMKANSLFTSLTERSEEDESNLNIEDLLVKATQIQTSF